MKTKIFAQIALVMGAIYGVSGLGTALATLPESPVVTELNRDTLRVALASVKRLWDKRLSQFSLLTEAKLAALRQFDTQNLNLETLTDESDKLLRVPEDVRRYLKCLTVDLNDDFKLLIVIEKGGWEYDTVSADGELIYENEFLVDGEFGDWGVKVLVADSGSSYVTLEPAVLEMLNSIELMEQVPEGVALALQGNVDEFKGVLAEMLRKHKLRRTEKYQELRKRMSYNKLKKVLLNVLKKIQEVNYESETVTKEKLSKSITELSKWVENVENGNGTRSSNRESKRYVGEGEMTDRDRPMSGDLMGDKSTTSNEGEQAPDYESSSEERNSGIYNNNGDDDGEEADGVQL